MVVLTAILKAVEGKGDDIEREFKKLAPIILKDPGALGYAVHRAVDDPNKFLVYEQYENQEALKYHGQTAHFKAFNQATRGMFAARAEITFYNKIV
ncbi:MAG: putative quinol monooxygenase [Dehalococcoidales bacterium]|nr:putative quinol monooxygenase [Dehalococcoidales bacterium]